MQVDPVEHPTLRAAVRRIYAVSWLLKSRYVADETGSGPARLLLWFIIAHLPESSVQRDRVERLRGTALVLEGSVVGLTVA